MKKLFALFLVLLLCFSTVACDSAPSPTEPSAAVTTTVPSTTVTSDPTVVTTTTTTAATTTRKPTTTTVKTTIKTTTVATTTTTTTLPTTATTTVAPVSRSQPLLYAVHHKNGATAWLFGSIHVGTAEIYPLPDYVLNALDKADSVAVELDPTVLSDEDYMLALRSRLYTDGSKITDHISADLYEVARGILTGSQIYDPYLDYYEPSFWAEMIDSILQGQTPYDSENGVDLHVISLAKQKGKPIHEIESLQSQYAVFGNFSPVLQELLLMDAVYSYQQGSQALTESISELLSVWSSGNEDRLRQSLAFDTNDPDKEIADCLAEYKKALYTDRDYAMYDYVYTCLKNGESVFVCVGAAHISGESGLSTLFRADAANDCVVEKVGP